jgi:hypothetical protein
MEICHRRKFLATVGRVVVPVSLCGAVGRLHTLGAEPSAGARSDRELMFLPASRQRELVVGKQVSAVELTEAALRRIETLDSKLHAFITVDRTGALAAAKVADAAVRQAATPKDLGLLHGVPVSVKDLEATRGLRTTFGSKVFQDYVPDRDSVVVERLRKAGAVILGKTNTPEFGASAETYNRVAPACNNPWDQTRIPGGSSGGAAVSVAAGMCALATGGDGGAPFGCPAIFRGPTVSSQPWDAYRAGEAWGDRPPIRSPWADPWPGRYVTRPSCCK